MQEQLVMVCNNVIRRLGCLSLKYYNQVIMHLPLYLQ